MLRECNEKGGDSNSRTKVYEVESIAMEEMFSIDQGEIQPEASVSLSHASLKLGQNDQVVLPRFMILRAAEASGGVWPAACDHLTCWW